MIGSNFAVEEKKGAACKYCILVPTHTKHTHCKLMVVCLRK